MRQETQEEFHLRLLSIAFFIYGGISLFCGCVPAVLQCGFGTVLLGGGAGTGEGEMALAGGLFLLIALVAMVAALITGGLALLTGWALANRRFYVFCIIVSLLLCLNMPFGTVLGVLTLIVLFRHEVKAMFDAAKMPPPPPYQEPGGYPPAHQ